MKKILLAFLFYLVYVHSATSQHVVPCLTDDVYRQSIIKNPDIQKIEDKANESARVQSGNLFSFKTGTILYIPVVFHIIHNNGPENISQAQIMDEIRVLNEDYRKVAGTNGGASTDPLAVDMQIEFRLAQYDQNGNKSDGINRIQSTQTDSAGDNVKSLSYWDSNRYLNVWVVHSISSGNTTGTILGYSQFPWQRASQPNTDGVLIRYDQIGAKNSLGYSSDISQAGRTLTHEIGHWLGLYHPFQNGCVGGTSSNCAAQGDQVCDTPPVANPSFGCPTNQNSCHNDVPDLLDKVQDYMDYADGTCMNLFTSGQKTRIYGMSFSGTNYRVNASSLTNLATTGIDGNTGRYLPVTASAKKAPYYYDFENANLTGDGWILNNFNDPSNGWKIRSGVSQKGSSSISMANFTNNTVPLNSRDGFQSAEIDLSTVTSPFLNFYYAYSQKSTATNDILNITVSDSFGMAEQGIFNQSGAALSTTGSTVTTEYIPAASEWKLVNIDLTTYKFYKNARFRFEFFNRRGNDIYVDNFSITDGPLSTGLTGLQKMVYRFSVQPNPMNETAQINFELPESQNVRISLSDITGREVMTVTNEILESGSHTAVLNKNNLNAGIYFIRFQAGQNTIHSKLFIN
ncbi:MAG: M43 family zinc metalloprotease [Bacteroidia bacterium]